MMRKEPKKYRIKWFTNVVKIKKFSLDLAFCERFKKIAFAKAEFLSALIIRDVYAQDKECEDGSWCLNLECPANKTSLNSWNRCNKQKLNEKGWTRLLEYIKEFESNLLKNCADEFDNWDMITHFPEAPIELKSEKR